MTSLDDRLDSLRHAPVPEGGSLGSLRRRIARRRLRRASLAGAVVAVVAGLVAVIPSERDEREVITVDTPPEARPDIPVPVALAGPSGVQVLHPDGRRQTVSTAPAAAAYAVEPDVVVFQDLVDGADYPNTALAVSVSAGGSTRALPVDGNADRVTLLDAGFVGGTASALVAERTGDTPDNTYEQLVRISIDDGTRFVVDRSLAWESSTEAARLLPDGDVVGLLGAEALLFLGRSSPAGQQWSIEIDFATSAWFASIGDRHVLVSPIPEEDQLSIRDIDVVSGSVGEPRTVALDPAGTDVGPCHDWLDGTRLLCTGPDGPVAISTVDGSVTELARVAASTVTAMRAAPAGATTSTASTDFAPDHESHCPAPPWNGSSSPSTFDGDGTYATLLSDIDFDARLVTFDIVQSLAGDDAARAYFEDTGDPEGPPNDYWVRNESGELRTLTIAADVRVWLVQLHIDSEPADGESSFDLLDDYFAAVRGWWGPDALANEQYGYSMRSPDRFLLTVDGGEVTRICELYAP